MIDGMVRLYQHVCRHDFQCYGVLHYVMSMRSETVYICRKCAYDRSLSEPVGGLSTEVTFSCDLA